MTKDIPWENCHGIFIMLKPINFILERVIYRHFYVTFNDLYGHITYNEILLEKDLSKPFVNEYVRENMYNLNKMTLFIISVCFFVRWQRT